MTTRPKVALVNGITEQGGSYLAELLLGNGCIFHGIERRVCLFNTELVENLCQDSHVDHRNFILHYGDLTDSSNLIRIMQQMQPDEVFDLGAQSHAAVRFASHTTGSSFLTSPSRLVCRAS